MAKGRMRWIALTVFILAANVQAAPATAQLVEKAAKSLFEQGWRKAGQAGEHLFHPRLPRSRGAYPVENFRIEEGAVLTQQEFGNKATDQVGRRCAATPSMEHDGWNRCADMSNLPIYLRR